MNDSNQTSHFVNSTNVYIDIVDPPTWSVNVFITVNVVILVLAVTGNGVILVVEQFNKKKTSTDWLVTFMSVNDIVLAGVNVPIYILMYNGSWTSFGSSFLCGMMLYIQETFSYSSTLLVTVTALDRYIKTCRPHATGITPRRSMFICIGVTLFTVVFCSPIPFYITYDEKQKCKYTSFGGASLVFNVMMFLVQGSFMVMFIVVIVSYCKVAFTIRMRIRSLTTAGHRLEVPSSKAQQTSPRENTTSQTLVTRLTFRNNRVSPLPPGQDAMLSELSQKNTESGMDEKNEFLNNGHVKPMQALKSEDNKEETELTSNNHNIIQSNLQSNDTADGVRKPKETLRHRIIPVQNHRSLREAQVNKTTAIMFAVTMVFIMSWVPPWVVAILWPTGFNGNVQESIVVLFCRRLFMVNTCTNPLFYIGMSSTFRQLTKQSMAKLWRRLQKAVGVIREV